MADWHRPKVRPLYQGNRRNRDKPLVIEDRRYGALPKQRPLTRDAEKILAEYFVRDAFWRACTAGAPIEWAGKELLKVQKTRSYAVKGELEALGGPHQWFAAAVLLAMQEGRIRGGRETSHSPLATVFFRELAGGAKAMDKLQRKLKEGDIDVINLEEVLGKISGENVLAAVQREAIQYEVYSHLQHGFA